MASRAEEAGVGGAELLQLWIMPLPWLIASDRSQTFAPGRKYGMVLRCIPSKAHVNVSAGWMYPLGGCIRWVDVSAGWM